jgi:trigger factor
MSRAGVAELADALDLGSSEETRGGSSPLARTKPTQPPAGTGLALEERNSPVLTTSVERLEGNCVKLTVTVPAEEVDKLITETYNRIGEKIRVPGFRKGKAPRPVIDNFVGRTNVLVEATEGVVNDWYPRAADAEGLRPIESPELGEIEPAQPGEDFTFTLEVELRPELEVGDYKDITIEVPRREVNDADMDAQILEFRERSATLEPVEDRGVQADDFVLLSFVGYIEGEPYEGNSVDKYLYEMGRGLMPDEFEQGLIGMKPGEEKRVEFPIPETSSNAEFVGKMGQFDITVHEIKARKLPEVDDDFAAEMGFDTLDAMKADLHSRLDLQRLLAYNSAKERAAREALAARTPGDIPEVMVKQRASSLETDFKTRLRDQGLTLEQYANLTGLTRESFDAQIGQDAEAQVREDLALEALFRAENMEVTERDIEDELADLAKASKTSVEEAREKWEKMGLMSVIREGVMHRKAVNWLMGNVKTVETEDGETAPEAATPAEGTKKTTRKRASKKTEAAAEAAESADAETPAE